MQRIACCLLLSLIACRAVADGLELPHSLETRRRLNFEAAVKDASTSPRYAAIILINAKTEIAQQTCVSGWGLILAIQREYHIGRAQALETALSAGDYTFRFEQQDALDLLPTRFSKQDLINVRSRLAFLSDEMLRGGFALRPWGWLHDTYREPRYKDAAACVVLERGLPAAIDDLTRALYIPWPAPSMP